MSNSTKTCFVIMPIGDQVHSGHELTADHLRTKYDDLIKEALLAADPNLEIVRADDIASPGVISTDILTHLMHSDIVVADISFPNPNVFYELGLRHACRPGTLLIRERSDERVPFDISHLRHFEYENTPTGLKNLANHFRAAIQRLARNPRHPDSQFLELAKVIRFQFPQYVDPAQPSPEEEMFTAFLQNPDLLGLAMRAGAGEKIPQEDFLAAIARHPQLAGMIAKSVVAGGHVSQLPPRPKKRKAT